MLDFADLEITHGTLTVIITDIAIALPRSMKIPLRAMLECLVFISNIVEIVYLAHVQEKRSSDTVYRCVAPAFVVKPALFIEVFEEFGVGFAAPEVEISDFEVGPD